MAPVRQNNGNLMARSKRMYCRVPKVGGTYNVYSTCGKREAGMMSIHIALVPASQFSRKNNPNPNIKTLNPKDTQLTLG